MAKADDKQRDATRESKASPAPRVTPPAARGGGANPLRALFAAGKMPITLEMHLTEDDRLAYSRLRQRILAQGYELPNLVVLGQYLRQIEPDSAALSAEEQHLARKLQVYADLLSSGAVDLVALDDGSRGRNTLDNAVAAELLIGLGVDAARLMVNLVARNRQADQVQRRLLHLAGLGVRNVLLLTGDLPTDPNTPAKFPLDSVGLCNLARGMLIDGSLPSDFWLSAAGHPNPDADPDGLRTLQKALAGAKVIVTQAIYSVDQFVDWMTCLKRLGVLDMVHVLAEVIPITSATQLRGIAGVPGMRVPDELIAELDAARNQIDVAAAAGGHDADWVRHRTRNEGARITRELLHRIRRVPGVSGFYLGCVKSFDAHLELLREAPLLPEHGDGLHRVVKIAGADRQRALAELPAVEALVDGIMYQYKARQRLAQTTRRIAKASWARRALKIMEWPKVPMFGCKKCDHCDLSADALVCPRGCAKQMTHGPCGAPRLVDGRMLCEDTSRECTWAKIHERRSAYGVGMSDVLGIRAAPSPGFYEGQTYSAVLPVLTGEKEPPNWSLAWRAPLARIAAAFNPGFRFTAEGNPRELATLAGSQREVLHGLLRMRPAAPLEEMVIKTLALIGTPTALHLIEHRLAEMGLPAEGTLGDLSLRELFQVAEALPNVRRRVAAGEVAAPSGTEELLRAIPEGRRLRQTMRRELANRLIQHIRSLGASVSYAGSLLESRSVDDFLSALTILKEELQLAAQRLRFDPGALGAYFHTIHYKHHYHAPLAIHWCETAEGSTLRARLQIDLKQFRGPARFRVDLRDALERLARGEAESAGAIVLEPFRP
ncbi:MAG: methylenetetrahydrofolate reductase C-terminal domain-containing protein, partial [Bryobacteraceae bacterium]